MSAAKAAPSNSRLVDRSALQARPQRGAPVRVAGQRDDGRAIGIDVAAHQLGQARGAQQARGDALGEGRALDRHHRHADPERLAGGGVGVARPGVEIDVGMGEPAEMALERQQRREHQPLGADAALARPPSSAPPGRWCSIAAARAPTRAARAAARTTGRTPRPRSCTTDGRRRAAAPPRARPSRHGSRAAAGRGARRSAGSNAAAGRSSR